MTPMPSAIAKEESSMPDPRFAAFAACLIGTVLLASAPVAQTFTTAAEVKPILTATKPQWIAVREYDGRDLLYFTNLLAWRCGVETVAYGINGAAPDTVLTMEPCYETEAQPNALKVEDILPYVTMDLGSVQTVTVRVTFDDGSTEEGSYERAKVMTP
jgi:hypothetical protein